MIIYSNGFVLLVLECAKTRNYPKPDPTRIFRVFPGVTWETWNLIKWNPARPGPEFSGSGFFSGFRVSRNVAHSTSTEEGVKNSARAAAAPAATMTLRERIAVGSFARGYFGFAHTVASSLQVKWWSSSLLNRERNYSFSTFLLLLLARRRALTVLCKCVRLGPVKKLASISYYYTSKYVKQSHVLCTTTFLRSKKLISLGLVNFPYQSFYYWSVVYSKYVCTTDIHLVSLFKQV